VSGERIRRNTVELQERARELRREMTEAEQVLWKALRGRRMAGLRFRRQHPVGRFVLDFYCPVAKLCVEVDGGIHDDQTERDEERTAVLAAGGYRVLRFRNEEVLTALPSILARIEAAAKQTHAPSPDNGEGGALSRYRERGQASVTSRG
jgi:very-short-patch-repair endonuclease